MTNRVPFLLRCFVTSVAVPILLSGCDDASPDLATPDAELRTGVFPVAGADDEVWDPKPWDCNDPEFSESIPPDPVTGECSIELVWTSTEFTKGQGATEGKGELSFEVTATTTSPASVASVSYPTSGQAIYSVGETKGHDTLVNTYVVPVNQSLPVEVCVHATEHDNGGINGDDDEYDSCQTITLRCDPVQGQPSRNLNFGPGPLCGPNQCNGKVSTSLKIMRADADLDDVPNDKDFTPEPCDEQDKGTAGVALLLYYHFDDDAFTTLGQGIYTDLEQVYDDYDYVVLVADSETSNPAGFNGAAFKHADRVYPPTRAGIRDAMQHLTAEGWRFDSFVHSHGFKQGADDSNFETLEGTENISGEWLVDMTEPDVAGTARGGIPIIAFWGTTCIAARQIDAWIEIGAKAASGAEDVEFYPNAWGNFTKDWANGTRYRKAVDDSVTATVVAAAEGIIAAIGVADWGCADVLLGGACADDFFNDSLGLNEAQYNIEEVYNPLLSGAANMAVSSARSFDGSGNLTFGAPGATWP